MDKNSLKCRKSFLCRRQYSWSDLFQLGYRPKCITTVSRSIAQSRGREEGGGGRIPSLCYAMYIFWLFFVELRICNFCLRTDQTDRSESSTVVSRNVPCVFLHLGAILPPQRPRHDALLSHFVVNKLMRVRTGVCVSGWRH